MIPFKLTPICIACTLSALAATAAWGQATPTPPADNNVQTIEVTGMRKSLRTTEEIKRDSIQVVDSINASDIGAFPDRSIGDALQRVSGVQITRDMGETADVIIRGLPDVSTTINGLEVFTGRGRRIAYQDLPVQSVAGLDVYKSLTADILEGGIAGSVNVRLAAPFDQKPGLFGGASADVRRLQAQGSSGTPHYNDPAVGGFLGNRWNSGAGEMGVLVDAYYQKDRYAYPVQWNDRPDRVWSVDTNGNATRLNPNAQGLYEPLTPTDRLASSSHVGGIYNAGDRERYSGHGAFQWKPTDKLEVNSHLLTMGYKSRRETDYIFSIVGWTPTATDVVVGPMGPGCLQTGGTVPICPVISSTNPRAQFGANPWNTDPFTATSTQAFDDRTTTNLASVGALYRDGPLRLSSDLAYSTSKFTRDYLIVDQQVLNASSQTYTLGPDGHGGFTSVTTPTSQNPLRDPNEFVMRGLVQGWSEEKGTQAQWRTDAEWALGDGFLRKVLGGIRLSQRKAEAHSAERANDINDASRPSPVQAFGPSFNRLVPGVDRLLGPFMTPDANFLLDQTDTVRQFYGAGAGRLAEDPTRYFEQTEKTYTAYLQGRFGFDVGEVSVLGNAGVRVVNVKRHLLGTTKTEVANQPAVFTPIDVDKSETNVLPSVSAVVSWTDRLQSHFSAGKTITRPAFADLNPALSLIPPTVNQFGFGNAGNPDLKPTKSTSLDATLEYYFAKNGYVQVAAFERRIDGYLQSFRQPEVHNGITYEVTRPQNSGKGRLHGVELGGQAFFDFLPGMWRNFGLQANYTFIDGKNETRPTVSGPFVEGPITNVAKHNYNLVLMYQGNGITGRLAATRRGEYTETIAEPPFNLNNIVRAATYVDLSLGYAITKNVSVTFDATNITHTKYESYIGDPSRPRDIRYTPSTYTLGVNFTL
jgi:TonB-dependent receptor